MLSISLAAAVILSSPDTSTSAEYLDRYRALIGLAPLGQVVPVSNFVLRRDAAEISLTQGTLYLLSPLGGRTVGAVFRGAGRISLTTPHPAEQEALRRAIGATSLNDSITELILLFADSTADQLRALGPRPGAVPGDVSGAVRDFVGNLKGRKDGTLFNPGILEAVLNDEPNGFFLAHVRRARGSPLLLQYDPGMVESLQLLQPASRMHYGAEWSVVTEFAPVRPLPGGTGMWRLRNRVAVPHYRLEVWLKPTAGGDLEYSARATLSLTVQEAAGPWLRFGLHPELRVDSARWSDGSTASTYKVNDDDDLWVRSPRRLAVGDSVSLTVFYHGDLIDRFANWFFIDPSADWYPVNGQGDMSAMFDVTFHSPDWYPLASVGERTDSSVAAKVMTTRWVTKRPTPFATFNLGLFKVDHVQFEDGPPLDVMVSEEARRALRDMGFSAAQRNMSQVVAADISNSLKWFTHAFGPPLFDHFFVTEIPYFEGVSFPGLIDLSFTTFQNTALDGFDEFFRAHEVAHQWWGNGVRPASYRDAWLSEGIASFCGLWYLQSVRKNNKEYFRFLDVYAQNIKDNRDAGVTWLGYRSSSPARRYGYQALVYEKGAWITHMLRMLMLDLTTRKEDRFNAMMRDFYESYAGASASTDDFRGIAEKHIGVPMDWFFEQWVKGAAIPTYRVAWTNETTAEGRQRVRLRVLQDDVPPDFQAWVLVSADLGQNRFANFRIKVTGGQTEYTSPLLPAAARDVKFNELNSVLADVKTERW